MSDFKEFSPFYKTRQTLLLLRWTFGFPLQAKDGSYLEFRFVTWLECIRFLIMVIFLNFCNLGMLLVLILFTDMNLKEIQEFLKLNMDIYSTNLLDNSLAYLWPMIVLMVWLGYFIMFRCNLDYINEFSSNVTAIKSKMSAMLVKTEKRLKKNKRMKLEAPEKLLIYGIILSTSTSILIGTWLGTHYEMFIKSYLHTQSNVPIVTFSILFAIQTLFLNYGPMSCASEIVICRYINSLTELFETFRQILDNSPNLPTIRSDESKMKHYYKSENDESSSQER